MNNKKKSLFDYFKEASKKPHYESVMWGSKGSLFAALFYYLVYFARFFSPLQYIKQFHRYRNSSKTEKKERADFHALHTELYFLAVFFFFLANSYIGFLGIESMLSKIVLWIFLLESIFWMLYYMLFRILMERHLSIFNEAEYFLSLPIVVATQTIIISALINDPKIGALSVLSIIFDLHDVDSKISEMLNTLLPFLGYIYTTVIIANLINLLPPIPVMRRQNITIIGAGDVVKNRMIDALLDIYKSSQISVVSTVIDDDMKKKLHKENISYKSFDNTNTIIDYIKTRSSFAVIATPTPTHFDYIVKLQQIGIPFAVEKPVTNIRAYLQQLKTNPDLMKNGFLLSYYWLEKALPLNYFLTLNIEYAKYIDISDKNLVPSQLQLYRMRLGKIKDVQISVIEKSEIETRHWSLQHENGGMVFETLIHPMTILCNLFENYEEMRIEDIHFFSTDISLSESLVTGAEIVGKINECTFTVMIDKDDDKVTKQHEQPKRWMEITYEHGKILVDFDTRCCTVELHGGKKLELRIKSEFEKKYEVQMLLMDSFIQNKCVWDTIRYDDYPKQVEILLFLFDNIYMKYLLR